MKVSITLLVAFYLTGCTTIVNGFSDDFKVTTLPPGAVVTTTLNGQDTGCPATPCEFKVSRKDSFVARVEKPGYHPVRIIVRNSEFIRAEIDDIKAIEAEGRASGILASDVAMMISSAAFTAGATDGTALSLFNFIFNGSNGGLAAFYGAPITAGIDTVTGSQQSLYPNPISLIMIPDTIEVPDNYKLRQLPEDELTFTNYSKSKGNQVLEVTKPDKLGSVTSN
jgi:hypothetical protein